jgi:hypothetical protein
MANEDHLNLLRQGVDAWNSWREKEPLVEPDLREANLKDAKLNGVNFSGAKLQRANLIGVYLNGANLVKASLNRAYMFGSDLIEARLMNASLQWADLTGAVLTGADLTEADLRLATLVQTNLENATLTRCKIYGASVWDLTVNKATKQGDLDISDVKVQGVTIDNIEIAQFVYLLMRNEKIGEAIDTIGKKGVLLLGRFTEGRIAVLERLKEELRKRDFLPMVFNFDKPETKTFTETVRSPVFRAL